MKDKMYINGNGELMLGKYLVLGFTKKTKIKKD